MRRRQHVVSRLPGLAALAVGVVLLLGPCWGCAGWGFSGGEVELLESAAADARFMARTWAERSEAERAEFVREDAHRWTIFNDLVHGRRPAQEVAPQPAAGDGGDT